MKKFLTSLTTCGTPAYIDLQLHNLKKYEDQSDFIVCDDNSNDKKLTEVCSKYNVPLIVPDKSGPSHDIGDLRLLLFSFRYAIENNYEYLLKVSRSFIMFDTPYRSLNWLIDESDGNTFSNKVTRFNYGFNTACICYKVKDWIPNIPTIESKIEEFTLNNPHFQYLRVEGLIHNLARKIEPRSEKYLFYKSNHYRESEESGYVGWDWIGSQWKHVPNYIHWHDDTNEKGYHQDAINAGILDYCIEDFKRQKDT